MTAGVLEPQQQRSRETLARLLKATVKMLDRHGLEGATIPRIATAAGVAPASVYRRFRNREALYSAALMDVLEKSAAHNRETLGGGTFVERGLDSAVAAVVTMTLQQYRAHPGLMRALTRFIEKEGTSEFRSRAMAIVAANFERLADMLLAFRTEIAHPDPRRAIMFALLTMATVIEVRALEPVSMWNEVMPADDEEIVGELTRNVVAYLRA